MDGKIINKFCDKGHDSEEKHVVTKKSLLATVRNEGVLIHQTIGENRKRMKKCLSEEYKRRSIV